MATLIVKVLSAQLKRPLLTKGRILQRVEAMSILVCMKAKRVPEIAWLVCSKLRQVYLNNHNLPAITESHQKNC